MFVSPLLARYLNHFLSTYFAVCQQGHARQVVLLYRFAEHIHALFLRRVPCFTEILLPDRDNYVHDQNAQRHQVYALIAEIPLGAVQQEVLQLTGAKVLALFEEHPPAQDPQALHQLLVPLPVLVAFQFA